MPEFGRLASAAHSLSLLTCRAVLGSIFVVGGRTVWKQPDGPATLAAPLLARTRRVAPVLTRCTDHQLVQLNAAVHMGGGAALAVGVATPAAAALLVGSLIPTTVAAFPFWEQPNGPMRVRQRADLLKNAGLAAGVLAVALKSKR